jgi:hypothetical protein
MTHDIDDLLEIIKQLELRILELEKCSYLKQPVPVTDAYYWEHG